MSANMTGEGAADDHASQGDFVRGHNCNIIPLALGDGQSILPLLQELAVEEARPDAVLATADALEALLFKGDRLAFGFKYMLHNHMAGFVLLARHYSSFRAAPLLYLEDIVVAKAYQGQGIGKALMAFLMAYSVQEGYAGLHWSAERANEAALQFYAKLGVAAEDRISYSLTKNDILKRGVKA